ncbi:hypothetical protein C8J56DRAFT_1046745 [Mycena floridula]|nr:hypothetical protein C8J56DRAFT_1046745 [Mycena floridula]
MTLIHNDSFSSLSSSCSSPFPSSHCVALGVKIFGSVANQQHILSVLMILVKTLLHTWVKFQALFVSRPLWSEIEDSETVLQLEM